MTYTGTYNQDIFDIVIRFYGSLDYLFLFLEANPQIISITEDTCGKIYNIVPNTTVNVTNFNKTSSVFATFSLTQGRSFDKSWSISWD